MLVDMLLKLLINAAPYLQENQVNVLHQMAKTRKQLHCLGDPAFTMDGVQSQCPVVILISPACLVSMLLCNTDKREKENKEIK